MAAWQDAAIRGGVKRIDRACDRSCHTCMQRVTTTNEMAPIDAAMLKNKKKCAG